VWKKLQARRFNAIAAIARHRGDSSRRIIVSYTDASGYARTRHSDSSTRQSGQHFNEAAATAAADIQI
jgi:hypothetical protein